MELPKYRRKPDSSVNDQYTPEQLTFMLAMDEFKRKNHCPYPTWAQVLKVFKDLGYRKPEGE